MSLQCWLLDSVTCDDIFVCENREMNFIFAGQNKSEQKGEVRLILKHQQSSKSFVPDYPSSLQLSNFCRSHDPGFC